MEDRIIDSESILQAILYKENALYKRGKREHPLTEKEARGHLDYIEKTRIMADERIHGKDHNPIKHGDAVAKLTYHLCTRRNIMGVERILITYSAMVHDIGKLDENIPPEILNKPEPLTPKERSIIQCHPVYSHELLYYSKKKKSKKC